MIIRKANLSDVSTIISFLDPFVKEGIILRRDEDEIAMNIRSYSLAFIKDKLVGIGALHIYSVFLGEIRSLAVKLDYQKRGIGKKIVNNLLKEAKELGLKEVLVLTYKEEFFKKLDFFKIEKEAIPDKKIWADCIKCKFFPNCNEVALLYSL